MSDRSAWVEEAERLYAALERLTVTDAAAHQWNNAAKALRTHRIAAPPPMDPTVLLTGRPTDDQAGHE